MAHLVFAADGNHKGRSKKKPRNRLLKSPLLKLVNVASQRRSAFYCHPAYWTRCITVLGRSRKDASLPLILCLLVLTSLWPRRTLALCLCWSLA